MSSLKENSVFVPDVWTGRKIERNIDALEVKHGKQVKILRKRIDELEDSIDGIERAFWAGFIGVVALNLAVVAMFVF